MLVPFICPVCGGRQRVPAGFYNLGVPSTSDPLEEVCRSCHGHGYILVEQPGENQQENQPDRFWEIKYGTIITNPDSTADWF